MRTLFLFLFLFPLDVHHVEPSKPHFSSNDLLPFLSLAADWPKQLQKMLPTSRPFLDAAIDSGGGPLGTQLIRLLRDGAIISCYGQTTMQPLDMPMALVLKNVEIRGAPRLSCFRDKTRKRL